MTTSIKERQQEVVDSFSELEDWEERYREIIKLGRDLDDLPDELKTDKHKVKGCQSQVWLHAALDGGNVIFQADSDAMIVRGLIAMLLSVYSGATPSEILENPPAFISEIKL
ncbi:MAG: SufE family protein, partial [Deltaproteobacteria bacterium]|nr:SufE family protein [Deltaproteobacteria bacterium]